MLLNLPRTEAAERLGDIANKLDTIPVIYKLSDDGQGANIVGLFEETDDLGEGYILAPLTSVYDGKEHFPVGTIFANVKGSSSDSKSPIPTDPDDPSKPFYPSKYESLIATIKALVGNDAASQCFAEENKIYTSPEYQTKADEFTCGNTIIGGHVMMKSPPTHEVGKDKRLHLLAICNRHNTCNIGNTGTGLGFYMKTRSNVITIKLREYMSISELILSSQTNSKVK